jgi:hypothetical protein
MMNQKDKQLTNFLNMAIGSALDDYMANLGQVISQNTTRC